MTSVIGLPFSSVPVIVKLSKLSSAAEVIVIGCAEARSATPDADNSPSIASAPVVPLA